LFDFIEEFSEDTRKKERMSFHTTLGLLNEIGSPGEIIQTLTPSEKDKSLSEKPMPPQPFQGVSLFCNHCQFNNTSDAVFCENCGSLLTDISIGRSFRQALIDHNLFVSFVFTYFCVGLIGVILNDLGFLAGFIWSENWRYVDGNLVMYLIVMLVPSIALAGLVSSLVSKLFDLDRKKSAKCKYNNAVDAFHGSFMSGVLLNTLAIYLFMFLFLLGFGEFLIYVLIIATANGIWTRVHFWHQNKPNDQPYFDLLRSKKLLARIVRERYYKFASILAFLSLLLSILTSFLMVSLNHYSSEHLILWTICGSLAFYSWFSGFFLMYHYDWDNVTNFIKRSLIST
jgi:hypothetical protein